MPPRPETHLTLRAVPRACAVGLDAILVPAKARRQYSWSKKAPPEASERDQAVAAWTSTARLCAAGLRGMPSEVVEQRLARYDAPFVKAVLAQLGRR